MRRKWSVWLVSPLLLLAAGAHAVAKARPAEPLPFLELVTRGANQAAELPLIVALHGRGDTAEAFAALFGQLPVAARVVIPRAPHTWRSGQAWFLKARTEPGNSARIAAELLALSDRVAATAAAVRASRPTRGPTVVMGFSQGAMLTWATAVRHPDKFAAAFPVAGFLFPEMIEGGPRPLAPARLPPIVAFHGTVDPLVDVAEDRRGADLLIKRGARVDLRTYEGVSHAMVPAMRADLFAAMARALDPAGAPPLAGTEIAAVSDGGRARLPPVDRNAQDDCAAPALDPASPSHTAPGMAAAAACFRQAGRLGNAIRAWLALSMAFPRSIEAALAVRELGPAYEATGSFAQAAEAHQRYARTQPRAADARARLVRALCIWRELGVRDRAAAALAELERTSPAGAKLDPSRLCQDLGPIATVGAAAGGRGAAGAAGR
jgi:phospholipase/carboxylesterase